MPPQPERRQGLGLDLNLMAVGRSTVPMSEIPRCTRDDVCLFRCLPQRGWDAQNDVTVELLFFKHITRIRQ